MPFRHRPATPRGRPRGSAKSNERSSSTTRCIRLSNGSASELISKSNDLLQPHRDDPYVKIKKIHRRFKKTSLEFQDALLAWTRPAFPGEREGAIHFRGKM